MTATSDPPIPPSEIESAAGIPLTRRKRSWFPLLLAFALLPLAYFIAITIQKVVEDPGTRDPMRVVIPAGFHGNLKIVYEAEDAGPLPREGNMRVVTVPRSGLVETSDSPQYGHAIDEFYRRMPGGELVSIPYHHIRERKIGMLGDTKEFFFAYLETEARDEIWRQRGWVNEDGSNQLRNPYEIIVFRSDLEY